LTPPLTEVLSVQVRKKTPAHDVHRIDIVELNEAFASQSLACMCELELDPTRVNPSGGAIALGHPISATGAIILTKLVYELNRSGKEWGLATMCMGGGQGISVLIRNEKY
jgi:acetyl-CoA C-acetyltransferase